MNHPTNCTCEDCRENISHKIYAELEKAEEPLNVALVNYENHQTQIGTIAYHYPPRSVFVVPSVGFGMDLVNALLYYDRGPLCFIDHVDSQLLGGFLFGKVNMLIVMRDLIEQMPAISSVNAYCLMEEISDDAVLKIVTKLIRPNKMKSTSMLEFSNLSTKYAMRYFPDMPEFEV